MQTADFSMRLHLERVPSLFSEGCESDAASGGEGERPDQRAQQMARRASLLRESVLQRASRVAQAIARAINPACLAAIGPTFDLLWRENTIGATGLPDPDTALAVPDGLAGLAGDLSPQTLRAAYGRGLHPRALTGPVTYWAPAQRLVLHPADIKLDNTLRGLLHSCEYHVTFDRDFDALLLACAEKSKAHAQMSPRMLHAFTGLFDNGAAHCFEVRDRQGRRIGGGFGIAAGRAFVLERSFSAVPGAARFGFAVLARHLAAWGFRIADATFAADLAEGMGFAPQARAVYNKSLDTAAGGGRLGRWRADPAIYAARTAVTAARHLFGDPPAPRPDLPEGLGLEAAGARTPVAAAKIPLPEERKVA